MRLSEKGCIHLNEWAVHKLPIDAFEFRPEDFQGAVVLMVDEAKTIKDLIWKLQCSQPNAMNADDWFTYWAMNGRIEQAEKSNE